MANKSGKKLAPTKKEWEQSTSRLAGGGEAGSGSFRGPQLHRSPFLSVHSFSCGVRKTGKRRTAPHQQRRGLWLGETSKVKTLAPEQNVLTDLKETVQWSEALGTRAGLDST